MSSMASAQHETVESSFQIQFSPCEYQETRHACSTADLEDTFAVVKNSITNVC